MHCTKCGTAVPDGASFCPGCGAPVSNPETPTSASEVQAGKARRRPGCLVVGLVIVAIVIGLAVLGSLLPKVPESHPPGGAAGKPADEPGELPLAVSAKALFGAYQANEASAQSYFGKRQLLVSGTVDKVALDLFDNPEVLLKTSNEFMSAHAALADDAKDKAGDYGPGDAIRLMCEDVSEVASIPMLKDCRPARKDQKGQPVTWSRK